MENVNRAITDIIILDEEWKKEWEILKKSNRPIVLFGAGCTSDFIIKVFREYNIEPVCFCDNDVNKQGEKIEGLEVLSLCDVIIRYGDCFFLYYDTTLLL